MNSIRKQEDLIKKLNSTIVFKLISIIKLPLAIITNLKIIDINQQYCKVSVKYNYFNKNPFGSIYFAVQSMAAELSTGALALLKAEGLNSDISFILVALNAKFLHKAKGQTIFICKDGENLQKAVSKTRLSNERVDQIVNTTGYDKNGQIISEFEFTWSFCLKKK